MLNSFLTYPTNDGKWELLNSLTNSISAWNLMLFHLNRKWSLVKEIKIANCLETMWWLLIYRIEHCNWPSEHGIWLYLKKSAQPMESISLAYNKLMLSFLGITENGVEILSNSRRLQVKALWSVLYGRQKKNIFNFLFKSPLYIINIYIRRFYGNSNVVFDHFVYKTKGTVTIPHGFNANKHFREQ